MGDTMLLATVVSNKEGSDVDFLPLTVEYREKYSASGKFPGGFFKRESRPGEPEILTARLIDRALRPMFPDDYHAETQVIVQLISADKENMPDGIAGLAASACLAVSDIPFNGPISEVRVARIEGKFQVNPTYAQLEAADMEMIIAGTIDNILMVEGEMNECSEDEMVEAIQVAHAAVKIQCQAQIELAAEVSKSKVKRTYSHETHDEDLKKRVFDFAMDKCKDVARNSSEKDERSAAFAAIKDEFVATLSEEEVAEYDNPYTIRLLSDILESNGSSSMATVCAGCLALMDGGIKVKAMVSGIAMGLITDGTKNMILSDILGDEDHLGDMDFKVTGTEKGITACQMDIKVDGLSTELLKEALYQA
ncbi:UNVERIFIED_CONTAM: hypothetical protein GTU68_066443, partial [Idotea baltica]|nr:hypothetical protein [Idotea baltica]